MLSVLVHSYVKAKVFFINYIGCNLLKVCLLKAVRTCWHLNTTKNVTQKQLQRCRRFYQFLDFHYFMNFVYSMILLYSNNVLFYLLVGDCRGKRCGKKIKLTS